MIQIYWNRAVGKLDGAGEELRFPDEPRKLAEIFYQIRKREFSFLGDFYEKYGPDVYFMNESATSLLQSSLIEYGKILIERSNKSEMKVLESIKFYHELEKIINDYKNHTQDWYEIFDPFSRYTLTEEKFLKKALEGNERAKGIDESVYKEIVMGYRSLENLKKRLENYIEMIMNENFPNLENIAGPILGAELLLLSNGIKNLANSPAGRIQIMGAGKAFYRSRKKNVPGPKHGIIFKHPIVHSSRDRGRSARVLAGKIAIAARIDYYSGKTDESFLENAKKSISKVSKGD